MPPGLGQATATNLVRQAHGLKWFLQWVRRYIKRAFGEAALDRFSYAWVREVGERGEHRVHIHMLWTAPYIAQAALAEAAERCGLGQRVDIRAIRSLQQMSEYCSKMGWYLSKEGQSSLPKGTRHYSLCAGVERPTSDPGWRYSLQGVHSIVWHVFEVHLAREERRAVFWSDLAGLVYDTA